jgi:hypothetical protein
MSALGLPRAKGFVMSSLADYRHDQLVFPRQQSNAFKALDWERTPPLKSWLDLLRPWLGLVLIAAVLLPFLL